MALGACSQLNSSDPLPTASLILTSTPTKIPVPTDTAAPTFTPTPSVTPTIAPTPIHPVGRLIFHGANDTISYNWFSYVPRSLPRDEPVYILITGLGTRRTEDYEQITEDVRGTANYLIDSQHGKGFVLLIPAIPLPEGMRYTLAFTREILTTTDEFLRRPDEKVILMINDLSEDLHNDGFDVQQKVFVEGFSAGGMFANRFTLLHPELVKAAAIGHSGSILTLPETHHNGQILNWPAGVYDYTSLVGYDFDKETYIQVPQLVYIGSEDTNTILPPGGPNNDFWGAGTTYSYLISQFGYMGPEMLEGQVEYLNKIGYINIQFKIYPDIGHTITEEMRVDVGEFLKANKE